MNIKDPKQKAEELVSDFIQMMPDNIDKIGHSYSQQYHVAKVQAEYVAHEVKYSHQEESYKYLYWKEVQNEIKKL
jgi:hypothetical protein